MWLTRKLAGEGGVRLHSGLVESESGFAVQGESRYDRPEMLLPYGFSSLAEPGGRAVMLDGYCAGLSSAPDQKLDPGEVRLYSAGGAEILLKRDGSVVINGQSFPRKEAD